MPPKYIAVAGNMGSGKSSLVSFLCKHFRLKPFFEPHEENPFLEDFYKDMKQWAFHSQIYFLSQKFQIHQELDGYSRTVVQDRTIFEDAEIFAKNLSQQGYIPPRDWKVYKSFYKTILKMIRPPDLLIFLKCGIPTIKKRIAKRGRLMEKSVPIDYLKRLNKLYARWISKYRASPLIVYRTDHLDYLTDFLDREDLLARIKKYL